MKKTVYLLTISFILILSTWSCEKDETSPVANYDFIALHLDDGETVMEPYLSLLRINNGEAEFTHLSDVYPYDYDGEWKRQIHQANGTLGFTLHSDLSESVGGWTKWTGAWMDMPAGTINTLPTLEACVDFGYDPGCNRFSFTLRNSVRIGTCGNIFYVAASQYISGMWHEEPRYRLVRLDPRTGDYDTSPLITPFTLAQPEINPNTYGLARINDKIFPSSCGQYVYGRTVAWGISGGNLIASRGIFFRYDFDNAEFSRINEVEYGFSPYYITADQKYLLYNHDPGSNRRRYNMNTGQVSVVEEAYVDGNPHQTGVNNYGTAGRAFPLREIWYQNVVADEIVKIGVPHNLSRSVQFSGDGSYLYFRYDHGDNNYLLRTSGLTEDATVDTVAVLPGNVRVMTILQ